MVMLADALVYAAMEWCVIPLKVAGKTPAVRWKRFQKQRPDKDQLGRWFDGKQDYGLAVVFGEASGGLASRDFDDLQSYQRWAADHPELAKMLPTVETSRGRHVYCRFASDDVAEFRRLIGKPDGIGAIRCDDGELRVEACYSVVPPSLHPSGFVYRWLVSPFDGPIPLITVAESGFYSIHATERTESTENPEKTEAIRGGCVCGGELSTGNVSGAELADCPADWDRTKIEAAIQATLPKGTGQRERLVLEFVRWLIAIPNLEKMRRNRAAEELLRPIVRRWHDLAKPFIGTPAFEQTWMDFRRAWRRARHPKGTEPMAKRVAEAMNADVPDCVKHYEFEPLKRLATLASDLQRRSGDVPIRLNVRALGKYWGVSYTTVARWISELVDDRILEVAEQHTRPKGNIPGRDRRFRYIGDLKVVLPSNGGS